MSISVNLRSCARCGGDHNNLVFAKFTRSLEVDGHDFTHWCMCPSVAQPILMEVTYQSDVSTENTLPPAEEE